MIDIQSFLTLFDQPTDQPFVREITSRAATTEGEHILFALAKDALPNFFYAELMSGLFRPTPFLTEILNLPDADSSPSLEAHVISLLLDESDRDVICESLEAMRRGERTLERHFGRIIFNGAVTWVFFTFAVSTFVPNERCLIVGAIDVLHTGRILKALHPHTVCGDFEDQVMNRIISASHLCSVSLIELEAPADVYIHLATRRLADTLEKDDDFVDFSRMFGSHTVVCVHPENVTFSGKPIPEHLEAEARKIFAEEGIADSVKITAHTFLGGPKRFEAIQERIKIAPFLSKALYYSKETTRITLKEAIEITMASHDNFAGFHLVIQPIVRTHDVHIIGGEFLIRVNDPSTGLRPDRFMAIFDKTILSIPIGRWVAENAAREASDFLKNVIPGLHFSFNMSPLQVRDKGFVRFLAKQFNQCGMDPRLMTLELIENEPTHNIAAMQKFIADIRALGMSTAIDDFGDNFNSLALLLQIPFDYMKYSRQMTQIALKNSNNLSFFKQFITTNRGHQIGTCIEGVETTEELELLEPLKADYFQGYLFSPPMSMADLKKLALEAPEAFVQNMDHDNFADDED